MFVVASRSGVIRRAGDSAPDATRATAKQLISRAESPKNWQRSIVLEVADAMTRRDGKQFHKGRQHSRSESGASASMLLAGCNCAEFMGAERIALWPGEKHFPTNEPAANFRI